MQTKRKVMVGNKKTIRKDILKENIELYIMIWSGHCISGFCAGKTIAFGSDEMGRME